MHYPSVSWHIISLKFSSWNIICFGRKESFECSNESSPNSSCHFWNHKVRVYSNFASLFSSKKDNSSVFFQLKPHILWTKEPIGVKFSDFWVVGWKFTKFLMSYLKLKVSFSLNLASFPLNLVSWEITLLYFFSWKFLSFGQKKPIKVQNFRIPTAHMKFNQICTLTGSSYWKYTKFQLKKYRGVVSWHWRVIQKFDLSFGKWHEKFGKFSRELLKLSKLRLWWVPVVQSRKCMS